MGNTGGVSDGSLNSIDASRRCADGSGIREGSCGIGERGVAENQRVATIKIESNRTIWRSRAIATHGAVVVLEVEFTGWKYGYIRRIVKRLDAWNGRDDHEATEGEDEKKAYE
jgi:hypothetical protein